MKKYRVSFILENRIGILVNLITLLRLPLTLVFLFLSKIFIVESKYIFGFYAVMVSFLIFISDYIDGKLARKHNCVTSLGQSLDVYMDFVFILSSLILFNMYQIIPAYFTFVIVYKFFEFIIFSKYLNRKTVSIKDGKYYFDKLGGFISVIYYIIPTLQLILMLMNVYKINLIMNCVLLITTLFTFIASINKLKLSIKK